MKHVPFLLWLLIVIPTAIGSFFAYQYGFFDQLYERDRSFLGFVIVALFAIISGRCGYMTYTRQYTGSKFGWMMSQSCLTLGMLGTVIGFIMILESFALINAGDSISTKLGMNKISIGLGTALYTTLVGLVASFILKLQHFNLDHALEQEKARERARGRFVVHAGVPNVNIDDEDVMDDNLGE